MQAAAGLLLVPLLLLVIAYGLAKQLGRPSGWFGRRLVGPVLNRTNKPLLDAAVEALEPRSGERLVDIGFGGGYALEALRARVAPERPIGVEISTAMIETARQRWSDAVDLHLADVMALPFADASIDGVLSVNTIYFWPEPIAALAEIRRVLKPGGRLVLGIRPPGAMRFGVVTWFGFRLHSVTRLRELLRSAGFVSDDVRQRVKGEVILVAQA